jgi:uncharacterized membrane protein
MNITEYLEEERDVAFKVIKIETDDYYSINVNEYVHPDVCKIIIKDKNLTKIHYFENFKETSLEEIVQRKRLNSFRR